MKDLLDEMPVYEVDDGFKQAIVECVEKAGFREEVKGAKTKKKTGKKASGYTLFMSHQMKGKKKSMEEAVSKWKDIKEEEKDEWRKKVKVENSEGTVKRKKKLTGYNIYTRVKIKEIKEEKTQQEKMRMVGEMWKKLTEKEKEEYKEQAKEENDSRLLQ